MNKPKIKISYKAYDKLMEFIKERHEINCIKVEASTKGCGPKVNFYFDHVNEDKITDYVDKLPLVYGKDISKDYKTIIIVYRKNSFSVKAERYSDDLQGILEGKTKGCGGKCGKHS
ncbi:hypothetical protein [Oceanirhabdus sp. W0125-5]|uniref:hypothetical protein n=1 Tax=Oceanirhabdus sp. W0125-5 TaxID=2999116 RepID=UPI0022F31C8E|nr:hypothetical protein [Oceanirhabdus sp. W0125-5]WBW96097.1 hypothetical protein OW730_20740 [Oceanirhabdus sp. W0125-5]